MDRASPRSRSRKPKPARTWPRCRPPLAVTDPPSSSTAARPGSRMPASLRYYVVFCRWPEGGEKSFVALVVDADNPGLTIGPTIDVIAPHPLGTLTFSDCRVPVDNVVGEPGQGHAGRAGHPGRFSHDRRRRRTGPCPPRVRRRLCGTSGVASRSASRWRNSR